MALFVLAFALALGCARTTARAAPRPRWRSVVAVGLLLAAASVFTFSVPGLAWFVIARPGLAGARGARRPQPGRLARGARPGSPPTG